VQNIDGDFILSPSDLTVFLACEHCTRLDIAAARGERKKPVRDDPELDVITSRGGEHELRYLQHLKERGLEVAEIHTEARGPSGWRQAEEMTLAALRRGVDAIYQATFFDGRWLGFADFLCRVDGESSLGAFRYEVEDTKLARQVKASALLQTCAYSEFLAPIQGVSPDQVHIVLGDMTRRSFPLREYGAYYRAVKRRFEDTIADPSGETYPTPMSHCAVCPWSEVCESRRRQDDHLSLVADIRGDQIRKLEAHGIHTVVDLAAMPSGTAVKRIGAPTLDRLRHQAELQVKGRDAGEVVHEVLTPVEEDIGLGALPPPSTGDLFFDIEGDPFVGDAGLEYLFGVVEIEAGESVFHAFWAHDAAEEMREFEALIDFFIERLDRDPALHIYHYAPYEPSALKRLMGRHATREDEVDRLLRGCVLVDLYRIVRQGLRISAESYSIKNLEPLYMGPREGAIADAASSIVAYEQWLESGDQEILEEIGHYNEVDCISTWKLREWLEKRRLELEGEAGETLPRPLPRDQAPSEKLAEIESENQALLDVLTAGLPEDETTWSAEERARYILGHLLAWHRREAKAEWWAYFSRLEATDEELVDDPEAIGDLIYEGVVETIKRSEVHRYRFDPAQDHKILEGNTPIDPAIEKSAGTVMRVDSRLGILDLKRGLARREPHPRSVIPGGPINTNEQREALRRIAYWVAEHAIDGPGKHGAARDLLRRRLPRIDGVTLGACLADSDEDLRDAAGRLINGMDNTALAVQGPPGSGKTWTGARVIVDLVESGRRVGITANSHKVIDNLLGEVCKVAETRGVPLRAMHKISNADQKTLDAVKYVTNNGSVETALESNSVEVVGGTAWLFARESLEERLDHLFVDEAGQLSLANVVAVAGCARNLVLLGDPQQLAQPSRGSHPPGTEVSALEHELGGHGTIPPERGLFLDRTWRLHPTICEYISEVAYEDRLLPADVCAQQDLEAADEPELGGVGLRYLPVEHRDNRTSSQEEAALIGERIESLLERTWRDRDGNVRTLSLDDILVVTPYNAQVACLAETLPDGARIGTVDKFQGQEAPVVLYSMGTSDLEQMPRGVEFLFSLNRLNVALSRAQGLAVLVCSRHLLRVCCRSPNEMRLVNALCRFVELAS
jgi:predicted RecB family nuclease